MEWSCRSNLYCYMLVISFEQFITISREHYNFTGEAWRLPAVHRDIWNHRSVPYGSIILSRQYLEDIQVNSSRLRTAPPSTTSSIPVINDAAGEKRKIVALAISSFDPYLCTGNLLPPSCREVSVESRSIPGVPSIGPGAIIKVMSKKRTSIMISIPITLVRIPKGPYSTAMTLQSASTPALPAETWLWKAVPW